MIKKGTYVVLEKPLTREESMSQRGDDGSISGVIAVSLWDLVRWGPETLWDALNERLTPLDLDGMDCEVVGHDGDTLHLRVWGDPTSFLAYEAEGIDEDS